MSRPVPARRGGGAGGARNGGISHSDKDGVGDSVAGRILAGRRRINGTWLAALPVAGISALGAAGLWNDQGAHAQGREAGGVRMTWGIEQRFETDSNGELDPGGSEDISQASTRLSFGLSSATRASSLSFTAAGKFRVAQGPDFNGTEAEFTEPEAGLSYARRSANADMSLSARYRESDVAFLRPLEDFIDQNGNLDLPPDLEDLNGNGTRRNLRANAALNWGRDGPVGFGVNGGYSIIDYSNTSSASLFDSRRASIGATLRAEIAPATNASAGLRFSTFDDDDPATSRRDSYGLDLGLSRAVENGLWSVGFNLSETEDGTQTGVNIGREMALPRGRLSASIGATAAAEGGVNLTGSLGYNQALSRLSSVSANLSRSISQGTDDTERLLTALSLGYSLTLSRLSSVSVNVLASESEDTATNQATRNASFGLSYSRSLTRDWGMNLGYRHRIRDVDGIPSANSDSFFLTIRRDFQIKY